MGVQMFVKPNYRISNLKILQLKLRYVNKIKEQELSCFQKGRHENTYHERQGWIAPSTGAATHLHPYCARGSRPESSTEPHL